MTNWKKVLDPIKNAPFFIELLQKIDNERQQGLEIYPPRESVFNAFCYTKFTDIKVVILGQDPYHGKNQAHGLAFSVPEGIDIPPSLINIYKELSSDIAQFKIPQHGCLKKWANQGVLLLNTVLTVRARMAHSHQNFGWELFTDQVINLIDEHRENIVFLLWGSHAQKKGASINREKHLVLSTSHPSPLSAYRGFLGSRHFSKVNQYLLNHDITPIDWQV